MHAIYKVSFYRPILLTAAFLFLLSGCASPSATKGGSVGGTIGSAVGTGIGTGVGVVVEATGKTLKFLSRPFHSSKES